MEKNIAVGDRVYVLRGHAGDLFAEVVRELPSREDPAEHTGRWQVLVSDRIYTIPEDAIGWVIKPYGQGKMPFEKGDKVVVRARAYMHRDKPATVVRFVADAVDGSPIYEVEFEDGRKTHFNYAWLESAPEEPKPESFKDQLQPGDRVKFKFGRQCGSVVRIHHESFPVERYLIQWDHSDQQYVESRQSLEVLYAPRTTDGPLPAQAQIDAIDELRKPIIEQVEYLQAKLRLLNQTKGMLKRL
jgi:hypothetical protein